MAKRAPENEEAEATESGEVLSYPVKNEKLTEQIERWKEQKRVRCCHKQSEESDYPGTCFYPLNPVFNSDHHHIVMETPEGPAIQAECSWDKRHMRRNGGPQFILLADLKAADEK